MRNALLSLFLFLLCPSFSVAENWEEISSNPAYLIGEGYGSSVKEAEDHALSDLLSQLKVYVQSESYQKTNRKEHNGNVSENAQFFASISTYAGATLTNMNRLIIKNEPDAHVGCWVKRSEINRIFEGRKAKILDLVEAALRAETSGKVDFALKDYYWALTLLNSMQFPDEVRYKSEEDGKEHLLMTWIPERMNHVFADVEAHVTGRNGDDVDLLFTYRGKPVNSLDYTYFDGRDWSNIYSAKNGQGVLELAQGNVSSTYQVKLEYEFRGEAHIDKELESVLAVVKSTPMRNAYLNVKAEVQADQPKLNEKSFTQVSADVYQKPEALANDAPYQQAVEQVVHAIRTRNYEAAAGLFSANGLDIYRQLIKYGSARIVGTPTYTFYRYGDEVVSRGLQLSFSFKSGMRKSFVEDVVFTFDKAGKIDNVAFGLGKTAEDDILGKGVWSETARMAIMQFLENYQTAYALKRLDYIETIFDDDAVIITGTVAKRNGGSHDDNGNIYLDNKIVKYNRFDKRSYLRHLAQSFASKEYINLRFANNDVVKLGKGGEMYAIQIAQEYYSSNYGDQGYLFLMVDINDPQKPIIKVRTWQPDKDPEFGLYGPEHFN